MEVRAIDRTIPDSTRGVGQPAKVDRNAWILAQISEGRIASDIARELGISRERVRQIHKDATGADLPARPPAVCAICGQGHRRADFADHKETIDHLVSKRARSASRFWAHVDQSGGADACWPFDTLNPVTGYGHYRGFGQSNAHRTAWAIIFGPIPKDQVIYHDLCTTKHCVNPVHLTMGSYADAINHAKERLGGWGPSLHPGRFRASRGSQRRDGLWVTQGKDASGKRKSYYGRTREAALAKRAAAEEDMLRPGNALRRQGQQGT